MRTTIAAVIAGAALCGGCAGYTKSDNTVYLSDGAFPPPVGVGGGDAGDAGTDAGADAGMDAGTDAGCVALSLNGLGVIDGCLNGQLATAMISVTPSSGCAASISFTTGTSPCVGTASGASDSFSGGCIGGGYANCTSTSLPGTIYCVTGPATACAILICDAGVCK
jgi:hypothetical protein